MKEIEVSNLKHCIGTIALDQVFPLKRWEDNNFGQKLFRAEQTLSAAGVSQEIQQLLVKREAVTLTNAADSVAMGVTAAAEAADQIKKQVDRIDRQLSDLADKRKLDPVLREALGIK